MTRALPKRALRPPVEVKKDASVLDAIKAMAEAKVGAVVVLEGGKPAGIFTERDVAIRVVLDKRDPESTKVKDVMTTDILTVTTDEDRSAALRRMLDRHIRHLPVVDKDGKMMAMLSMRHLLREDITDLEHSVESLVAYAGADGPGG